MYEKYFVMFRMTGTLESKELAQLMDVPNEGTKIHYKGFSTKARMKEYIQQHEKAFREYQMLKPIE